MNALIICSVDALCDVSALERNAFNRACALSGIPASLTRQDHARMVATATMLDVLNCFPGSISQRQLLIGRYLETLNDEIWSASIPARESIFSTLLDANAHARAIGLVSEYPALTTHLIRSAALLSNASKLGLLTTLTNPLSVQSSAAGLSASAVSLNVMHDDIEVLVAHQRDFDAARSLGMHPRFVEELRPIAKLNRKRCEPGVQTPTAAQKNSAPVQQPVQILAF